MDFKSPTTTITVGNTLALMAVTVYGYRNLSEIKVQLEHHDAELKKQRQELSTIATNLAQVASALGELHRGDDQKLDAIKNLSGDVKKIKNTIADNTSTNILARELEALSTALRKQGSAVPPLNLTPPKKKSRRSRRRDSSESEEEDQEQRELLDFVGHFKSASN